MDNSKEHSEVLTPTIDTLPSIHEPELTMSPTSTFSGSLFPPASLNNPDLVNIMHPTTPFIVNVLTSTLTSDSGHSTLLDSDTSTFSDQQLG
ncbi:hypothetical protein BGZ94_001103, partial [Podila epigama]